MTAWRRAIAESDALVIATPEYNGSIPGQLKNALDWASRPVGAAVLANKPVATCSVSPSRYGGEWAQAQLRKVLENSGAQIVGDPLIVPVGHERFDSDGALVDIELAGRLAAMIDGLVAAVRPFFEVGTDR